MVKLWIDAVNKHGDDAALVRLPDRHVAHRSCGITGRQLTCSLDMWDFNENTLGFFINYASIVGLYATLTHYALGLPGTVRARGVEGRRRRAERYGR